MHTYLSNHVHWACVSQYKQEADCLLQVAWLQKKSTMNERAVCSDAEFNSSTTRSSTQFQVGTESAHQDKYKGRLNLHLIVSSLVVGRSRLVLLTHFFFHSGTCTGLTGGRSPG